MTNLPFVVSMRFGAVMVCHSARAQASFFVGNQGFILAETVYGSTSFEVSPLFVFMDTSTACTAVFFSLSMLSV